VALDLAALHPRMLLKLAGGGVEGVAQGDVEVLVGLPVVMVPAHHDVLLRDAEIDPDFVEITLMLVMVFCFDGDAAANDVVAELLELRRFFPNPGFYRVGMANAPKRNL
jgi:hypothetical protein